MEASPVTAAEQLSEATTLRALVDQVRNGEVDATHELCCIVTRVGETNKNAKI